MMESNIQTMSEQLPVMLPNRQILAAAADFEGKWDHQTTNAIFYFLREKLSPSANVKDIPS